MTAIVLATVGHGSTALWYLTRATGLVSLILLSATVVLGTVASVGWTSDRWPRFLSQSVHRNLSLFCIALIGVHVVTTVGDGYVPIGLADAVIPFRSPYRPIWVGLGAVAFDMLLAVAITSALRRRIGVAAWRGVHWLAYACWPIAVVHGLGSGSDARLPGAQVVFVLCTGRGRRRSGLAPGGGEGALGDLAARRRRRRRGGARGDRGLRGGRSAAARLVPPGRHLLRPAWPSCPAPPRRRTPRHRRRRPRPPPPRPPRASRAPPSRRPCRERSPPQPPMATATPRSPSRMQPADTTVPLVVRIIGPADQRRCRPAPQRGDLRPAERAGDGPRRVHHRCVRHRPDRLPQPDHEPVAESWRPAHSPASSRGAPRNEPHPPSGRRARRGPRTRLLYGLAGEGASDPGLGTHLERWGELRHQPHRLIDELEASGLVGHGGAWFPVAAKWRAVAGASRRRPVVVANGAEGEPASRKDALLLSRAPHLVLDGLALAANTLRAQQAIVYVPASSMPTVEAALAERRAHRLDPIAIELAESPDTFISGQESAVVNALGGRRGAVPVLRRADDHPRARGRGPTHPGAERRDARPCGPRRPLRSGLVPGGRHADRTRARCC